MFRYRQEMIIIISFAILFGQNFKDENQKMNITSSAFSSEELIPPKYTCDGENISPPLSWSHAPKSTRSFVLICDDPDAPMGTWDHWILFNIPVEIAAFPENISVSELSGIKSGRNSWGRNGYGGPCPPSGTHRYFFKLYALDSMLSVQEGSSKKEIENAMDGHILAEAVLMGRYKRK